MMPKRFEVGAATLSRRFKLFRRLGEGGAGCVGGCGSALHFRTYRLGKLRDNCLCS
jgi:hypothetical protein